MKAFIARSFNENDKNIIDKFIKYFESLGVKCEDGEKPEFDFIEEKIKRRIDENDIFIAISTCDKELLSEEGGQKKYSTSNWVMQESGYAIGKEKKCIFLVEQGVYKFSNLQGSLEYIKFNREQLSDAFTNINYIIKSLDIKSINQVSIERKEDEGKKIEKKREIKDAVDILKLPDKEEPDKRKIFIKIFKLIFEEKDLNESKKLFYEKYMPRLNADEKVTNEAVFLRWFHSLGDFESFRKLKRLAEHNNENPRVLIQLALDFINMEQFSQARDCFIKARKLYEKSFNENIDDIIYCYNEESKCLILENKKEEGLETLKNLLYDDRLKNHKGKILDKLAYLYLSENLLNNVENFFIYAEGALEHDPNNSDLRSDLGYQYSEKGIDDLSLLHYKKVCNISINPVALNNLGVQYERLNLVSKSVINYFDSAKKKNTLALANICQRYIRAGFINDAKEKLKESYKLANEGIEIHENIGEVQKLINKTLKSENEKEKEILKEAEEKRLFWVEYSDSYCTNIELKNDKIKGKWITNWCKDFRLEYDEDRKVLKGVGVVKTKDNLMSSLMRKEGFPRVEFYLKKEINLESKINQLSGKYCEKIQEQHEDEKGNLLGEPKKYIVNGYLAISKDCKHISILEESEEKKSKHFIWEKTINLL